MTRHQLLTQLRHQFNAANIFDGASEARDLVLAALHISRSDLIISSDSSVLEKESAQAISYMNRRLNGEPVDRILGYREFYGRKFYLNADTLSPREDSECVINLALNMVQEGYHKLRILDLGTGTGCLLLTLLSELPNATGLGVDLSENAVTMAAKNAQNLKLDARAKFKTSNWFESVHEQFDLVISNPPYIETAVLPDLEREVRDHDPVLALDGGRDGLDCYKIISAHAHKALCKNGHIIVEIGMGQANAVTGLFTNKGFTLESSCMDSAGITRGLAFKSSFFKPCD